MLGLGIVAGVIAFYAIVQRRLTTTVVSGPLLLMVLGLVLSPQGLGLVDLEIDASVAQILLKATLVILLFTEASELEPRRIFREAVLPSRLLVVGMPLVIILGAVAAALAFEGIGIWEAALLAAILAPTDAALGMPVVSNKRVPGPIRRALTVEAGLNDGLAVPFAFAFAAAGEVLASEVTASDALVFLLEQIVLGTLVGIAIGWLGARGISSALRSGWASSGSAQIAFVAFAGAAYAGAEWIHGNGFISVWVAGLVFALVGRQALHPQGFATSTGELLILLSFFVFGIALLAPTLTRLEAPWIVFALVSLVVVRPVAVALATVGSGLRWPTVAYMGWFGPRGIASLVLAVLIYKDFAMENIDTVIDVVTVTVGLSVLLHGASAWIGSQTYADWIESEGSEPLDRFDDSEAGDGSR
jgi:NhaP-type Na+/H+ or K+/H+ antiporter